jgi:esterase/lipase
LPGIPGNGFCNHFTGLIQMYGKWLGGFLGLFLLLIAALMLTAPPELLNSARVHDVSGDLDAWLAKREREVSAHTAIIPGTEKRIRWFQGRKNEKARYSVVYFHGFSASRQEIAPVGELISQALRANLFETRLTGHGHRNNPLEGVRAEQWLNDAAEALQIGAEIGERVVVMGTSTGATLALAMLDHPLFEKVSDIVLLSPNFGLRDTNTEFLTWPGGPQLAYLVAGDTHSWTPRNELQAQFWSYSYPMDAVIEMMRLVQFVRDKLPTQLEQSLLTIYSPQDTVVDTQWITLAFEQMDSPRKQLITIPGSADRDNHVLAGDIMLPENNQLITDHVVQFVTSGAMNFTER